MGTENVRMPFGLTEPRTMTEALIHNFETHIVDMPEWMVCPNQEYDSKQLGAS